MRLFCSLILVIFLVLIMFMGCGMNDETNSITNNEDVLAYSSGNLTEEMDKILLKYKIDSTLIENHPIIEEFEKADPSKKVEIALGLADDMAMSCVLDFENSSTFALASYIVKEYPHPLLLNNFGSMLAEKSHDDSLFFLLKALEQVPDDPVILTNAAYLFIELDNFSEAESCALRALKAAPDFGPAYQILTTVHLKNGDDILAAETMVKSAKHCFNDITIHHFESFLEAVGELDPEVEEFPLKEEFIKELYIISKENVDTQFINDGLDTPEAQIKIKPFPKIDTVSLMEQYTNFYEMEQEINFISFDVNQEYYKYMDAVDNHLNDNTPGGKGIYPIQKNLRQIYAFKVLQSYYNFKLEKCRVAYEKEMDKLNEQAYESISKIEEGQSDYSKAEDNEHPPETLEEIVADYNRQVEELNKACEDSEVYLKKKKTVLDGLSPKAISLSIDCYNEIKQILEEYWLRAGGIIKYITNEDVLIQFNLERTLSVYHYISVPLDGMLVWTGEYENLEVEFAVDSVLDSIFDSTEQASREEAMNPPPFEGEDDSLVPDIEKQSITTFAEKSDLPDIGFEGDLFGVGGSVQTDGEKFKYSLDTPASSMGQSKNMLNDDPWDKCYLESYFALGSKAQGSTDWFIENSKTVKDAVGKGSKIIGNIGYVNGKLEGGYICQSKSGKITDRGIIHIREVGGSMGMFGKSDVVVVKKSTVTGLAIKEKSTKFKFGFGSLSIK